MKVYDYMVNLNVFRKIIGLAIFSILWFNNIGRGVKRYPHKPVNLSA